MYSFIEIKTIFSNCNSAQEIKQIREAFAIVFEDKSISNAQLFFIRKQSRLRNRELENFKK
jgi:hypothetical protein